VTEVLGIENKIGKRVIREAFKKNCVFYDIGPKGGWVPVSKHNFFYIRNYDIYQRWVGVKHRCHISYIHNLLLKLAYFQFHGEKGVNITMLQT